jgi:hypothetical protein
MRALRLGLKVIAAALLCLSVPACAQQEDKELSALGLMGTIPVYWGEADGVEQLVAGQGTAHWARAQLERSYVLQPIDSLDEAVLRPLDFLLLAQPRALSAAENVALDNWVRAGGKLLLFADPLLTGESRFALGDRRRPQEVILLSPVLDHWGLALRFDEEQAGGLTTREIAGTALPVSLAGHFELAGRGESCQLLAQGLVAQCEIGEGRVTAVADAALLDLHEPDRRASGALGKLSRLAFTSPGNSEQSPMPVEK